MPHINIKIKAGKPEDRTQKLASKIQEDVAEILECKRSVISVSIEEIEPSEWPEKVYRPEIIEKAYKLYIKPGYNPFE